MPKKVLIIDDDPNTVRYLSVVLSDHGYDTASSSDGNAGFEKIKQAIPDLLVLDVMMPKKTGFVLFEQLKKDDRYKDIPVLMLTGVSGVLDDLESRKDEASEKPYDSLRQSLAKKIRQLRDEGLIRPEMFMDKPVDLDSFIANVQELIGS